MTHRAQRITATLVLIAALILLTGCSGTRSLRKPAQSLEEVNVKLRNRDATIRLLGEDSLLNAFNVSVAQDSTRYTRDGTAYALLTSQVQEIEARTYSAGFAGAMICIIPAGVCHSRSASGPMGSGPRDTAAAALLASGLLVGFGTGHLISPGRQAVVYTGPLENYLP